MLPKTLAKIGNFNGLTNSSGSAGITSSPASIGAKPSRSSNSSVGQEIGTCDIDGIKQISTGSEGDVPVEEDSGNASPSKSSVAKVFQLLFNLLKYHQNFSFFDWNFVNFLTNFLYKFDVW